jgi:predicted dehydrogenase
MVNKISVIGLGYIGKIHLRVLHENPHWKIAGIYDVKPQLTGELAAQYGVKAFNSLEEAIESSDALSIATPSSTHYEIARRCIVAGRHVFVEKPVTALLPEARLLKNLVAEAGVVLQAGHVERFNPAFIASLPYIKEPVFIEAHRLAQYNRRGTDVSVVLDLMMHDLDLIISIVRSDVKKVSVSGTKLVSASADIVNARIEFANGCVANVTTNRMAFRNSRKLRVFTRTNLVSINLLDKVTEVIKIRDAGRDTGNLVIDPGEGLPKKEIIFEHPIILPTNAINEELSSFHHCINSNKASKVGIDDAIRTLELAFNIEELLEL